MYGTVNVPGVSMVDLMQAIEDLKSDMFNGELSVPLATTDGTIIETNGGAGILAVKKLGGLTEADMNAAVHAAVSGMASQVRSTRTRPQQRYRQTSRQITASSRMPWRAWRPQLWRYNRLKIRR